jgi:hypothetical protein
VHTLVVHSAVAAAAASQSSMAGFPVSRSVPSPPGTTTTDGAARSANAMSGSTRSPLAHRTGSVRSAASTTRSGSFPALASNNADAVNTLI